MQRDLPAAADSVERASLSHPPRQRSEANAERHIGRTLLAFYEDIRILKAQVGFKEAKRRVVEALREGTFLHEARSQVETKNLLQIGQITPDDLTEIVKRCSGQHHERSPHHSVAGIEVHILRRDGWYVKFYFVDPDTIFISVHQ